MANRFFLLIGNGDFPDEPALTQLHGPPNDVRQLGDVLARCNPPESTKIVRLQEATHTEILEAVEGILDEGSRGDLYVLYFSGHGKPDARGGLCLLARNTRVNRLFSTSVPFSSLKAVIDNAQRDQVVVLLDCCYSGAVGKALSGVRSTVDDFLQQQAAEGLCIVTSSSGTQTSMEREGDADGVVLGNFTRCLIDGIASAKADINADGAISVDDITKYVKTTLRGQKPQVWGLGRSGDPVLAWNRAKIERERRTALRQAALVATAQARGMLDTDSREAIRLVANALGPLHDEGARPVLEALEVLRAALSGVARRTTLEVDPHAVRCAAQSAAAGRIAIGTAAGEILLFDPASGRVVTSTPGHSGAVRHLAWSSAGAYLTSAGEDRVVRVWTVADGRLVPACRLPQAAPVTCVATHDAPPSVLVGCENGDVLVWDIARRGRVIARRRAYDGPVLSIAIDPSGQHVVGTGADGAARYWQRSDGLKSEMPLRAHVNEVRCAAWAPDGYFFATGGADGTVNLCSRDGRQHRRYVFPGEEIGRLAYGPDGAEFVAATSAGMLHVCPTMSDAAPRDVRMAPGAVLDAGFTDAEPSSVCGSPELGWARWTSRQLERPTVAYTAYRLLGADYTPDGSRFLLATHGRTCVIRTSGATIWNARSGVAEVVFAGHEGGANAAAFSPDGRQVVTAGTDRQAFVWDVPHRATQDRSCTVVLSPRLRLPHAHEVLSAAFSPSGEHIVTTDAGGMTSLWRASDGACVQRLEGRGGRMRVARFNPAGDLLAGAGDDPDVLVWAVHDLARAPVRLGRGHTAGVLDLTWSHDGRLATASEDRTVRIWDPEAARELRVLEGHQGQVNVVAWSPDDRTLASGGTDGVVRLWDVASGECWGTLGGGDDPVRAIAYDRIGGWLLAAHGREHMLASGVLAQTQAVVQQYMLDAATLLAQAKLPS